MQKTMTLFSLCLTMLFLGCSSDDTESSFDINSKEVVIKGISGEWVREKIVDRVTGQELPKEDYFMDSFTYLNFYHGNVVLVTWYYFESQGYPDRKVESTYRVGENGEIWIKAPDTWEIDEKHDLFIIEKLTNTKMILYNKDNRLNVNEIYKRIR